MARPKTTTVIPSRRSERLKEKKKPRITPMTEFKKYPKLCDDLKIHLSSWWYPKTLQQFSQCSKFSNWVIQRYNTRAPDALTIKETDDGVEVILEYYSRNKRLRKEKTHTTMKKFRSADHANMAMEIAKYLEAKLNFVRDEVIAEINIDMESWPHPVMDLEKIRKVDNWKVVMYPNMYDDFLEFTRSSERFVKIRNFVDTDEARQQVQTLPDCIKPEYINNLAVFFNMKSCAIDEDPDEPFFEYEMKSTMSKEELQDAVLHMNRTPCNSTYNLRLDNPESEYYWIGRWQLFNGPRFKNVSVYDGQQRHFEIGKVVGEIDSDGRILLLSIYKNWEMIPTDESRKPFSFFR